MVAAQVRLGVVGERLRAVAALEQERLTAGDRGQPVLQPVDLGGHGDRRHALQHGADLRRPRPASGQSGCCAAGRASAVVEALPQGGGQGRQAGQASTGASTDQFTAGQGRPCRR